MASQRSKRPTQHPNRAPPHYYANTVAEPQPTQHTVKALGLHSAQCFTHTAYLIVDDYTAETTPRLKLEISENHKIYLALIR